MDEFEDVALICICGDTFIWTAGEQKFYQEKGYFQPKRCVSCRAKKKNKARAQKPIYELK